MHTITYTLREREREWENERDRERERITIWKRDVHSTTLMFHYAYKMSQNYAYENKYNNHIKIYKTLLLIMINDHKCYWLNLENDNTYWKVYALYLSNHYNSFRMPMQKLLVFFFFMKVILCTGLKVTHKNYLWYYIYFIST